jgi:DNA primase
MGRISQHSIEELKMRVNIVDEVERHVKLQKAGKSYKGLSPFTSEKTPSFYVNPEKGAFYCFSSTQGGDVIRFIELVEHLPFYEAIETLAQRHNIVLEYEDGGGPGREERSLRRELLEIHEAAADFFHRSFLASDDLAGKVRAYWLEKRRFSMEVAEQFKIGFDIPTGDALLKYLLGKGFSPKALMESGIFTGPEGVADVRHMRSRFRGRMMIPIREPSQGQVVAFTARELFCTPGADTMKLGKYVNSPGTPLFQKSHILFNLDRAQKPVRENKGGFMMVEGQLDSIRSFTNGFTSTVAPQGTSVTDEQMHIMKRYSDHLRVVLDGDGAGQRAALRSLPMALAAGLEPTFVVLPPGKDPDSLILEGGPEALQKLVDAEMLPMEFLAKYLRKMPEFSGPRGLAEAMKKVTEILAIIDNEVARSGYLAEICKGLGVDYSAAFADLSRFRLRAGRSAVIPEAGKTVDDSSKVEKLSSIEADIWLCLFKKEKYAVILSRIIDDRWIDVGPIEGRLLGRFLWDLKDGNCDSIASFASSLTEESERNCICAMQVQSDSRSDDDVGRCLDEMLMSLFIRFRKKRLEEIDNQIATSGASGPELNVLMEERMQLLRTVKQQPCLTVQDR